MNNGLRHFDAMLFVPMFMVSMTVITSISVVYFPEFVNFTVLQYIFYHLACCALQVVFSFCLKETQRKKQSIQKHLFP